MERERENCDWQLIVGLFLSLI